MKVLKRITGVHGSYIHNKKFRTCSIKGFKNILLLALFNVANSIVERETGVSL